MSKRSRRRRKRMKKAAEAGVYRRARKAGRKVHPADLLWAEAGAATRASLRDKADRA